MLRSLVFNGTTAYSFTIALIFSHIHYSDAGPELHLRDRAGGISLVHHIHQLEGLVFNCKIVQ